MPSDTSRNIMMSGGFSMDLWRGSDSSVPMQGAEVGLSFPMFCGDTFCFSPVGMKFTANNSFDDNGKVTSYSEKGSLYPSVFLKLRDGNQLNLYLDASAGASFRHFSSEASDFMRGSLFGSAAIRAFMPGGFGMGFGVFIDQKISEPLNADALMGGLFGEINLWL